MVEVVNAHAQPREPPKPRHVHVMCRPKDFPHQVTRRKKAGKECLGLPASISPLCLIALNRARSSGMNLLHERTNPIFCQKGLGAFLLRLALLVEALNNQ